MDLEAKSTIEFPEVERQQRDQPDDDGQGQEGQGVESRGAPAQADRVEGPARHRRQHPKVAGVEPQRGKRLGVAAGHDHCHTAQREQDAPGLPRVTRCPSSRYDRVTMSTGVVETSSTALVAVVVCSPR